MNIIDELQWRGLINQSTDLEALREACENPIALYCDSTLPVTPSMQVTSFRLLCCVASKKRGTTRSR